MQKPKERSQTTPPRRPKNKTMLDLIMEAGNEALKRVEDELTARRREKLPPPKKKSEGIAGAD